MTSDECVCVQLQQQCGRELCIVVTNLSRMCSEYCNIETCPDLPIRAAVRMSMAFPGQFSLFVFLPRSVHFTRYTEMCHIHVLVA